MRNFSCNKQYLIAKEIKTSNKKNENEKKYWVFKFRDADTNRILSFHIFQEDEIKDDNDDFIVTDMPYIINGYINNVGYNIFLNVVSIKKDKKELKRNTKK